MLAEDTFERLMNEATAALEGVLSSAKTEAETDHEAGGTFWRGRLAPHAANACPFECVIHKSQHFDLHMASLKAERQPLSEPRLLVDLARAAVSGTAVVRHYRSANTGLELARELRVPLTNGRIWTFRHPSSAGAELHMAAAIADDEHFVPYARG